jgi:hypothetical protein
MIPNATFATGGSASVPRHCCTFDMPAPVEIYRGGKQQIYERPLPQPVWSWSYRRAAEHFIE